jgi:hypothetical protein
MGSIYSSRTVPKSALLMAVRPDVGTNLEVEVHRGGYRRLKRLLGPEREREIRRAWRKLHNVELSIRQ